MVLIHQFDLEHNMSSDTNTWAVWMGTAYDVISVQFKNEDDIDDVAPPSQDGAFGSAE